MFEAGLALACATMPRVYSSVGRALDPDRMPTQAGQLVVKAAQAVARDHGSPPSSLAVVLQRMRVMVEVDGKVTYEQFKAAEELLQAASDVDAADDPDALIAEAAPVVQRFAQQEAVEKTISDFGKGVPADRAAERFEAVAAIGEAKEEVTLRLVHSATDVVSSFETLGERLPTGITDLDLLLRGGLECRALGVALGATGTGKSFLLVQIAAEALLSGLDVAYFTLELPAHVVRARVYANLTNLTADEIRSDAGEEAARRLREIAPRSGRLVVSYHTACATTPADLRQCMREWERADGFRPRVLVFDMGDHLVSRVGTDLRSYDDMRKVYAALRSMAIERDGWAWTASHVKGGNSGKKHIAADEVSDSQHKSRTADLMVAITSTDEERRAGLVRFTLPKRRNDDAAGVAGPMPRDEARGRIAFVSRGLPWG
jgi:hypothetical protein